MNNRDSMHPQDIRNLILFAVLSISMWLFYDHRIVRPQAEAARQKAQELQLAGINTPQAEKNANAVLPRMEMIGETPRVKIETSTVDGSINLKGARIDDLRLKNYYKQVDKKDEVELLSPARTPFPRYVEMGWVPSTILPGMPGADTLWHVKGGGNAVLTPSTPVTLQTDTGGLTFERKISIDESYGFTIKNSVINKTGAAVTLHPFALVTEHGLPEDYLNLGIIHEGPIAYLDERLEEEGYKDFKKKPEKTYSASTGWIGITGKYWLTALAPVDQTKTVRYRFVSTPASGLETKNRMQTDLTGDAIEIAPGATADFTINVFSGPKKLSLLESYETKWNIPHFDMAVDFGWFYFLTKPFFLALNFLYGLIGNFGLAIIAFTCILRIFVFPLANISYRSFAKLRQVSPEMYNLRHQYKDDKQRLQQELVKLYQKHEVNPMAGCLPMLVQIPIFFSLYKVLSNTIEMRHAPFFGWIHDLSVKDPTSILNLFGFLPWDAPSFAHIGAWPVLMFIGLMIQKNISPPPEDPIQARLMMVMPFLMTYIMAGFASGLVIYWTFNNVLAILQQVIIMKSMGVPIHLFSKDKIKEKLEKEIAEGPVVHPALELTEHQIEDAILGEDEKRPVTPPKPKKKKKK